MSILTVMNAEQMSQVLGAIRTLHSLFGVDLGTFDACGESEHKEILSRAHTAIGATAKDKRNDVIKRTKRAVDEVIESARKEYLKAVEEIAKLSPAVRALTGVNIPDSFKVPLSDLADIFPTGMSAEQMVPFLHQMGYLLAKGNHKVPCILVSMKPALTRVA